MTSVDEEEPPGDNSELLVTAVSGALNLEAGTVKESDTFLELGGDSLAALYVSEELASRGYELDPMILFEDGSLRQAALSMRRVS
jgi:hypothetical protein